MTPDDTMDHATREVIARVLQQHTETLRMWVAAEKKRVQLRDALKATQDALLLALERIDKLERGEVDLPLKERLDAAVLALTSDEASRVPIPHEPSSNPSSGRSSEAGDGGPDAGRRVSGSSAPQAGDS
jgi:hypothetical protein